MSELRFYVFSYNRGDFLANCVRSIEDCAPWASITVVDDDSTDPGTRDTLAAIARHHRVLGPGASSEHKHGGLYGNMQAALEEAPAEAIACFLQDDTQLVRKVDPSEATALADRFAGSDTLGFVSPCFVRGRTWARNGGMRFDYDRALDLFFPGPTGRSAGVHYSDVCLLHAGRLRAVGWRFETGEPANERAARARFGRLGYLPGPFAMWLPQVPAYRGRTKSLALRWAERRNDCGLHPIRYLDPAAAARLGRTDAGHPPVAEDWLSVAGGTVRTPWIYDPLQGSRWLKHLNRLELLGRRGLARLGRRA